MSRDEALVFLGSRWRTAADRETAARTFEAMLVVSGADGVEHLVRRLLDETSPGLDEADLAAIRWAEEFLESQQRSRGRR